MKINYPFLEASFIDRPNRFLTRVKYKNKIVTSHLPDPGRLKELLKPGVRILIKEEKGTHRKTAYSTQAVYKNNVLISLNTLIPNQFTEYLLREKKLIFLKNWEIDKKEVSYGRHRFDFRLKKGNKILLLEVKSVSLVENSIAMFPDAVTERGRNHVKYLGNMAGEGISTMVLFVIQRPDSVLFQPQWERDVKFGHALYKAWQNGMTVKVIHMKMTKSNIQYLGEIPFDLNPKS